MEWKEHRYSLEGAVSQVVVRRKMKELRWERNGSITVVLVEPLKPIKRRVVMIGTAKLGPRTIWRAGSGKEGGKRWWQW